MLITTMITSISNAFAKLMDFLKVKKEHQTENEIIKDKRDYKNATNIAENMFKIAFKYVNQFSKNDKKKFIKLFDDFQRVN